MGWVSEGVYGFLVLARGLIEARLQAVEKMPETREKLMMLVSEERNDGRASLSMVDDTPS